MELTKWLKPSISVSRIGDSASVQAATRVNAEQASKRTMCRPTRLPYRGRLTWPGGQGYAARHSAGLTPLTTACESLHPPVRVGMEEARAGAKPRQSHRDLCR